MWEKLLEILLRKYLEGRTPKRRAAKVLVGLYVSMVNCHDAYLQFIDQNSNENLTKWSSTVETLAHNVYEVRNALHIFGPEIYDLLRSYISTEIMVLSEMRAASDLDHACLLIYLVDEFSRTSLHGRSTSRYTITNGEEHRTQEDIPADDFKKAVDKLRGFIKESFSFEDILDL